MTYRKRRSAIVYGLDNRVEAIKNNVPSFDDEYWQEYRRSRREDHDDGLEQQKVQVQDYSKETGCIQPGRQQTKSKNHFADPVTDEQREAIDEGYRRAIAAEEEDSHQMNKEELVRVGRLAFRVEGDYWNCYYAQDGTMKGSVLMGSLRMTLARIPNIKGQFVDLMRDAISQSTELAIGIRIASFETEKAPEHERTKKA